MHSERGSMLVQVGIALLVILAFLAFVVDYGLLWVARRQAQNAADAAALAGAVSRAFDEPGDADPVAGGVTEGNINYVVDAHQIAGTVGNDSGRTWSWACPPEWDPGRCVRVNVFRNGEQGSPLLPIWFGQLLGLTDQGTRATATAIAADANGSNCLKPWIIPDRWLEVAPPADTFDEMGGDVYQAPTELAAGTGYTTDDYGTVLTLKAGNPHQAISPSDFYEMEEASSYEEAITGCRITKKIGDSVWVLPGGRVGPTNHGVDDLTANGPVIVNIAMFSPAEFYAQDRQSGMFQLTIVNMLAFEITGRSGNQITGTIVGGPGEMIPGGLPPGGNAAMLQKIMLVR